MEDSITVASDAIESSQDLSLMGEQSSINIAPESLNIKINSAPDTHIGANNRISNDYNELEPTTKIKQENGGYSTCSLVSYEIYSDESDCEMFDVQHPISQLNGIIPKIEPHSEIVKSTPNDTIPAIPLPDPLLLVKIKEEPPDKPVKLFGSAPLNKKTKRDKSEVSKLYNLYQKIDFQIPNPDDSDESLDQSSSSSDSEDSEDEIIVTGPYRESVLIILSSDSEIDSDSSTDTETSSSEDNTQKISDIKPKYSQPLQSKKKRIDKDSISFKLGFDGVLPNIEDLHISIEEKDAKAIGIIENIINVQVIVRAYPGIPAIDLNSVLFLNQGRKVLGKVFDIYGHVSEPYYMVRFNSEEHVKANNVEMGLEVFFAPQSDHTKYVLLDDLMKLNYSDRHAYSVRSYDNEIAEEAPDFSDDEEERKYHQVMLQKDDPMPKRRRNSYNPFDNFERLPNYPRNNHSNNERQYNNPRIEHSGGYNSNRLMAQSPTQDVKPRIWDVPPTQHFRSDDPILKPTIIDIDPWANRPSPCASPLLNKHKFGQPAAIGMDVKPFDIYNIPNCQPLTTSTRNPIMCMPPPPIKKANPPLPVLQNTLLTPGHFSSTPVILLDQKPLRLEATASIINMPPPPVSPINIINRPPPAVSPVNMLNRPPPSISPINVPNKLPPLVSPINLPNRPPPPVSPINVINRPPPPISPINILYRPPPPISPINILNVQPPASSLLSTTLSQPILLNCNTNTVTPMISTDLGRNQSMPIVQPQSIVIPQISRPSPFESSLTIPLNILNEPNPWDKPLPKNNNNNPEILPNPWAIPPNFNNC